MLSPVLLSALSLLIQGHRDAPLSVDISRPSYSANAALVLRDSAGAWTETIEFDLTVDEYRPLEEEGRYETFYTVRRRRPGEDGGLAYFTTDSRRCPAVAAILTRIAALPQPQTSLPGFSDPAKEPEGAYAVLHAPVSELWVRANLDDHSPARVRLTSSWGLISDLAMEARTLLASCWEVSTERP